MVASQTDVIPEIVDLTEKGFGITIEPENTQELANAIRYLLKNDRLRKQIGNGARNYVEQERSWMTVAQQTQTILNALTNK